MTGLHVMFVCTANISRSPYAERRARQALGAHDVVVSSAGVPGYPGRTMDPAMAAQLVARNGDADGHVSRSVTAELLDAADLVLVFEFAQHMRLLDAHPEIRGKVLSLGQLARAEGRPDAGDDVHGSRRLPSGDLMTMLAAAVGPSSMSNDIADPFRRGKRAAATCADSIDAALDTVLPMIVGAELSPLATAVAEPSRRGRWPWSRRR